MSIDTGNWFENQNEVSTKIDGISSDGATWVGDVTGNVAGNVTGDVTGDINAAAYTTTGSGAGLLATTYGLPRTTRWKKNGTIIKEIKFDMTGLKSAAVANDVIGLAAGVAYIGGYSAASDGVIYKTELICLELPTTGDDDVNVVELASAALIFEGNGGTAYVVDGGVAVKGGVVENFTPALTGGEYWYLTAGAGDTAGTYDAGMFILRTYGHAVLA